MKLPAFMFYPGDWLRDPISGCSLAAQGLWLRLMILMHDAERYGYLSINGSPIPPDQLARRCGCSLVEFEPLFAELETAGVPRRTKDGIIYSKRMSEDAEDRAKNAERQRRYYEKTKGEPNGNPNGQPNTKPNANLTDTSHELHTPSSYSLSSSSSKEKREEVSREKSRSPNNQCDEDFLAELQNNPTYAEFNVKKIYGKFSVWCGVNNKQPTRRGFVNWLNREDKQMKINVKEKPKFVAPA